MYKYNVIIFVYSDLSSMYYYEIKKMTLPIVQHLHNTLHIREKKNENKKSDAEILCSFCF